MQDRRDWAARDSDEVWSQETSCRLLAREGSGTGGGVLHCITEPRMHLIRAREATGSGLMETGTVLQLPSEESEGEVSQILGTTRHRELPTSAQNSLHEVLSDMVSANPKPLLDFYNKAGPVSLKFHAFQLLPGIGPSKAQQMVKSRKREGWMTIEEVDEACAIESLELFVGRLVDELKDPKSVPSLIDNVVRAGA